MKIGYAQVSTNGPESGLADGRFTLGAVRRVFADQGAGRAPLLRGKDCFRQLPRSGKVTCRGLEARPQGAPVNFFISLRSRSRSCQRRGG